MRHHSANNNNRPIKGVFSGCVTAFVGIALMSALVNILYLTGSLFMMEVYDRVLPSRSLPTLLALFAIAAVLYAFQGLFDAIRGRLLVRISDRLDQVLSSKVYDAVIGLQLRLPVSGRQAQPLRDLDTIRSFLSGSGPTALFDLPWLPFYIAICFAFHFWLGVTALRLRGHPHGVYADDGAGLQATGGRSRATCVQTQPADRSHPPQRRYHFGHGHGHAAQGSLADG